MNRKLLITAAAVVVVGRGRRWSVRLHAPDSDPAVRRHGAQLFQVDECAARLGNHRAQSSVHGDSGDRGPRRPRRRRRQIQPPGTGPATTRRSRRSASPSLPRSIRERRRTEGAVHLRHQGTHQLRVRPDRGERRPDRHHRNTPSSRSIPPIATRTGARTWTRRPACCRQRGARLPGRPAVPRRR